VIAGLLCFLLFLFLSFFLGAPHWAFEKGWSGGSDARPSHPGRRRCCQVLPECGRACQWSVQEVTSGSNRSTKGVECPGKVKGAIAMGKSGIWCQTLATRRTKHAFHNQGTIASGYKEYTHTANPAWYSNRKWAPSDTFLRSLHILVTSVAQRKLLYCSMVW
jgi:hypothetical protein